MRKLNFEELRKLLSCKEEEEKELENIVREIIEKVKKEGDNAIIHFTEKFDGVKLKNLKVKKEEREKAKEKFKEILETVEKTAERIERYHKKQLLSGFKIKERYATIDFKFSPVKRTGIYIPGGQSPLISTVLMTVIPAKVAGVEEIYISSPPSYDGKVHPLIVAVADFFGVKEIFSAGGAQAIGGFAYGTETIPSVDIIAGPGNKYVNMAKKIVYGKVGIDLPAGPSEVVIFSDNSGKKEFIETDLKAQMEHTDATGIFITTSEKLGKYLSRKVKGGYWIKVKDEKEALKIINFIAPEHLQIISKNEDFLVKNSIAGALFVGNYTPSATGDYFAGPSHVLPTGKSARFSSGLSVYTFLRGYAVIKTKKEFYRKYGEIIEKFPEIENLKNHLLSLRIRRKEI